MVSYPTLSAPIFHLVVIMLQYVIIVYNMAYPVGLTVARSPGFNPGSDKKCYWVFLIEFLSTSPEFVTWRCDTVTPFFLLAILSTINIQHRVTDITDTEVSDTVSRVTHFNFNVSSVTFRTVLKT